MDEKKDLTIGDLGCAIPIVLTFLMVLFILSIPWLVALARAYIDWVHRVTNG